MQLGTFIGFLVEQTPVCSIFFQRLQGESKKRFMKVRFHWHCHRHWKSSRRCNFCGGGGATVCV